MSEPLSILKGEIKRLGFVSNEKISLFEQPAIEHPTKKLRIEQGWKSYKASDARSVELPSQIFDMLKSNKFVPESRMKYYDIFLNLNAGQSIILPNLGQEPKHFAIGYQGRRVFVTEQMINIWGKISADKGRSIKHVLSSPMGVGKSYISYFLASKAYASGWITLYIADASELILDLSVQAGEVICKYFLAMNKDILSATELKEIVRHADVNQPAHVVAKNILNFLKTSDHQSLLIIDEHGALFEYDPPVPKKLSLLSPLMNINYWAQHHKLARVVFTGTAHAKYEREHMINGTKQECLIFVGPLESNIFDELLELHPALNELSIKKEVKRITNCVPCELVHLVDYIDKGKYTIIDTDIDDFLQALKKFEEERVDEILGSAQQYYKVLQPFEKNRYYQCLTRMFLPSLPTVQFDLEFLDLGLIYQYEEKSIIHSIPICPSAQKALIKMYVTDFDIPGSVKN
ncbi:hypothetical protein RclHR1_05900008 [Rhizophagus clarus]|uniref:Uncharacterized protein n=1 Tax=Rhizophagus clarus TaxID=94130 RepID=A0A2Z6RRD4_9GLOM|nr:hypothetical protein RclHR1_05900008 [Rhizophagus clarus]